MQKLLPYLFSSEAKTYSYHVPKEVIKEKIDAIFNKSGKFLSEPDFDGCFTSGDAFEMSVDSGAVKTGNAKFGSVLYGKMSEVDNGKTIIETVIKVRFPLKLIAIVSSSVSFGYLYKSISELSLSYFLWAIGMLVLSPIICNWFAGVFNTTIRERFEKYIHSEIKKMSRTNTSLLP